MSTLEQQCASRHWAILCYSLAFSKAGSQGRTLRLRACLGLSHVATVRSFMMRTAVASREKDITHHTCRVVVTMDLFRTRLSHARSFCSALPYPVFFFFAGTSFRTDPSLTSKAESNCLLRSGFCCRTASAGSARRRDGSSCTGSVRKGAGAAWKALARQDFGFHAIRDFL